MPKSLLQKIIKPSKVKNRRRGVRSWETRRKGLVKTDKFIEIANEPAVHIERQVLRVTNKLYYALEVKSNPNFPVSAVIDFPTAVFEVAGRFSREKFAELLDAGQEVSTRKATYSLYSSNVIHTTKKEALAKSLAETSRVLTMLKTVR